MQDFVRHINSKNKKFKCYLNSDESETLSLTVDIYNELNPGATEKEISLLTELVPDNNEQIVAFYKLYNGIKLYCNGDTSGLQFYSIGNLQDLNDEWKGGHSDFEEDELYDFQKSGVAFGEISHSGNYFIFFDSKVYYDDHDGRDDTTVGESFNDFLSNILANPADFLYERGCYTRYSDGKTNGQYIPKEFIADET
ncbi:MAG: hypothetical protein J0I84_11770 [Terrimonas sp.]|nr:hypothetical protein [Terrimonas sp.]OJY96855.1 MAG: hypothetical protein BGP13_20210 [Sphingobacteriales bacterium 40-81]